MSKNGSVQVDQMSDARKGSTDPLVLVRNLQRQLHLQRSALDAIHAEHRQAERKLRHISSSLLTAQEVERKRLAAELHDSIGQALSVMSFGVSSALECTGNGDHERATERLKKLQLHVKSTLEDVRRIAKNLRPAILDDLGIVGTLSWFFREFIEMYPNIALHRCVAVDEADLPQGMQTPIFRIVQEAFNNIIKHAQASEVWITLEHGANGLTLEIRDNGQGFLIEEDPARAVQSSSGIGVAVMRDRVEFASGEFLMQSAPGKGTLIRAVWPNFSQSEAAAFGPR